MSFKVSFLDVNAMDSTQNLCIEWYSSRARTRDDMREPDSDDELAFGIEFGGHSALSLSGY